MLKQSKKIVISSSTSLQKDISKWKKEFEEKGYEVIDYPLQIPKQTFLKDYPLIHKKFIENIKKTDILFVMNEDKNNIKGYIGAETFAELSFGVIQKVVNNQNIKILLLKKPSKEVQSYEEIKLWLKLKWLDIYKY